MEIRLSDFKIKQMGVIKRILDNPIAAKLLEYGILPGAQFCILNKAPFNGPIFIQIDTNRIALRRNEAEFIIVE